MEARMMQGLRRPRPLADMLSRTGSLLLLLVALVSMSQTVESTSVIINNGRLELDIVGWNVTLYVQQYNANTKSWARLDSFRYSITPVFIVETWDVKDLEYGNRPHNYTLPTSGSAGFSTVESKKAYPNDATASMFESRAILPNGATFVMKVEVFDQQTYKDLNGWRLPLTNQTLKTTFKVYDWPQFQTLPDPSENGVMINVSEHRSLAVHAIFEMLLLAPIGTSDYLRLDPVLWPFYVFADVPATTTLANPAVVPSLPLTEYLFTFRHRYFNLNVTYLQNSLRCPDGTSPDDQCTWDKLDYGQFQEPGVSEDKVINLLFSQMPSGFDESKPAYLKLPLFFGFVIRNETSIEWDPNLDIMFNADFDIAATPGSAASDGNLAAAIAVPIAAVIVCAAIVGVIVWRRNRSRMERKFFVNTMMQHQQQEEQQRQKPSSGTNPSKPGKSGGWETSHTPAEIRNTL